MRGFVDGFCVELTYMHSFIHPSIDPSIHSTCRINLCLFCYLCFVGSVQDVRMTLTGVECRLQTCGRLTSERFDSAFRAYCLLLGCIRKGSLACSSLLGLSFWTSIGKLRRTKSITWHQIVFHCSIWTVLIWNKHIIHTYISPCHRDAFWDTFRNLASTKHSIPL